MSEPAAAHSHSVLRPLERRVRHLSAAGVDHAEIGQRFRRRPDTIDRIMAWTELPRDRSPVQGDVLRALERRVLRWREDGADFDEIAPKFRRSPGFIQQVERLALLK